MKKTECRKTKETKETKEGKYMMKRQNKGFN